MKQWVVFLMVLIGMNLTAQKIDEKKYARLREKMVQEQIINNGITNTRVLNAFRRVKRHLFVKPDQMEEAYLDLNLLLTKEWYMAKVYPQALISSLIADNPQNKVLEIGTGPGYHTAILAELVHEVYTIEIDERRADEAKKRLLKLGYRNIKFKVGDGLLGWKENAPFDGIDVIACSPDSLPETLLEQLALGGRMVIAQRNSEMDYEMVLVEKQMDGKIKQTNLIPLQVAPGIRKQ